MTAPSFSAFYCTGGSACIYALVKTRCYERPHQNQGPVLRELYQHFNNDSFRLWSHLDVELRDAVVWWWPDENGSDHVGKVGYVCVTCSFFYLFRLCVAARCRASVAWSHRIMGDTSCEEAASRWKTGQKRKDWLIPDLNCSILVLLFSTPLKSEQCSPMSVV